LLTAREEASLRELWGESAQARQTLQAVLELREALRKEVIAWERGGALRRGFVDRLNQIMEQHPMRTKLNAKRGSASMELWFEAYQPDDLLAPLAHAAASLFVNVDRARVRKCGNCVLHFRDTSKKGTRRWCSMQLCGNRLKVAAYAARQRLSASDQVAPKASAVSTSAKVGPICH
jgi:predicted RNA-binding Zn ribbon-like protein